ncbi:MAG: amidohydrolase family protein [Acidimicrobiales bacterium]|nr:amidohydrolase family protein [Acidimicrobiales bacterium]
MDELNAWHAQVVEDPIDPDRPIVDPHHHLWHGHVFPRYLLAELWADTDAGHNVTHTVYMECGSEYRTEGPAHLKPVGETEFVRAQAQLSNEGSPDQARIAAIVAHADLTSGSLLDEVLDAHEAASQGMFRGIRHAGASDPEPESLLIAGHAPPDLYANNDFRAGVARLGERGYTYDTWHYHHQNPAFAELARAVPGTTLVLGHFGTPLGVGRFAGRRDSIFEQWKTDVADIASCPNVVAKLGGMAMPDNGFGWFGRDRPPTSDEFVEAQAPWYHHMIECFGADRCMFESNFPVDRLSISYNILWNGLKKIAADYSEAEQEALFRGTASRIYRLNTAVSGTG